MYHTYMSNRSKKILHKPKSRLSSISALTISSMSLLAFFTPHLASAQGNVSDLVIAFQKIINLLIPLVASLALLAFFWGLAKYIFNAGSEEDQKQGKKIMIAGVIGLFLIAAIGGIIDFIALALGVGGDNFITPPTIMYNGGDGIG